MDRDRRPSRRRPVIELAHREALAEDTTRLPRGHEARDAASILTASASGRSALAVVTREHPAGGAEARGYRRMSAVAPKVSTSGSTEALSTLDRMRW